MSAPWYLWIMAAISVLMLPFECRRFYLNAGRGEISWWNAFEILMSVTVIVIVAAGVVQP